ncbi:hypothetical protein EC09BKT24447_3046 [Escherichia coli 09BKT024447]|nr:hypothetical protein EC09BKT24447_3046 [Escherichia coli 09BKT024447]QKQ79646.1 hypothetical protein FCV42_08770 [Escherichia coli O157:H7]
MLPSETMIWQPEFTDKTLSRKTGAVQAAKNTECKKSQVYFCICGGRREFGLYVRINVPV